ncbi:MAG: hypothetical protein V5A51_08740 [Bacteroidales bacterium]
MKDLDLKNNNCLPMKKFHRRKELTLEIRLYIACIALLDNRWGTITRLAKKYAISRTFVYMLQSELYQATEPVFGVNQLTNHNIHYEAKKQTIKNALLFRLEGKCSIPSTSDILKRMDLPFNSVGSISQLLNEIGSHLSPTLEWNTDTHLYIYLASDEVFAYSRPVLISVDPVSSAIIKIQLAGSRQTSQWIDHFKQLKKNGVKIIKIISDEGISLCSASKTLLESRQPDTFHAISHRLGKWIKSLEKSAYGTIQEEYDKLEVFESAKSRQVIQKRLDSYFEAQVKSNKAILLYEDFKFLYNCIIEQLQVFDKQGNPRDRKKAEENIRLSLDLMISLPIPKVKKAINTIYNLLDNLLDYLNVAKKAIWKLKSEGIPEYIIQLFSLAWQHEKNMIKAKQGQRRKHYQKKMEEEFKLLEMILKDKFTAIKTKVFSQLNLIVQSSAIVENINSIIRNYLATSRNHIHQNALNLIMFYHNHRRYKAGKRKGQTPMELLTGKSQKQDWLELLMNKVDIRNI